MTLSRSWFSRGLDQDWVDRANGFWSVLLLSVCSLGAFMARYITQPISCVCPAQFTESQVKYALDTCFMKEEFYRVVDEDIPRKNAQQDLVETHHLWIPLMLFIQALCFKIPNIIWNACKRNLSINLDATVSSLQQSQLMNTESRNPTFQAAARVVDSLLKRNSFFLGVTYLVTKLLFLINLLGQFVFITVYFRNELLVKVGRYIEHDLDSFVKPLLTKIAFCSYKIRRMARVEEYTHQCVFPITEVYEKMYVFLWYWIFFVGVATFFNLLLWAGYLFIPFLRDSRISTYINATPGPPKDSSSISRFISSSLGLDGAFLMSMISQNSSEMVAANLSQEMYEVFLQKNRPTPFSQPETSTSGSAGLDPGSETVAMTTMEDNSGMDEKAPIV